MKFLLSILECCKVSVAPLSEFGGSKELTGILRVGAVQELVRVR